MCVKRALSKLVQLAGGRILFNLAIPRVSVKFGIPGAETRQLLAREPGDLNLDLFDFAHGIQG